MRAFYKKFKNPSLTPQNHTNFKRARAEYRRALNEARRNAWENFCKKETSPFGKTKDFDFANYFDPTLEVFPTMLTGSDHTRLDILKHLTSTLFGPSSTPILPPTSHSLNQEPPFSFLEL